MKILITGDKGFVGRNFTRRLQGHEIVGVDIKDGLDCRDFFKTNNEVFDLVIHLAAIVGGRLKIEGDPISVATDLSIDAEMFNWAVRTKQKKIVYFSSSAAYPIEAQRGEYKLKESDIDLNNIKNPDMSYGWAKLTGEFLASFARQQGIDVYVFRLFSGYGEDQDLDYPFPSFIKRIKEKQDPFDIWGDGKQVRDFVHIDDIFDAVMATVEANYQEPVNIGTGIPTNFIQLAEKCFEVANWTPNKIKLHTDKPVGVMYRCADTEISHGIYKPKITLEEGIKRSYETD